MSQKKKKQKKTWSLFKTGIIPLFIKQAFQILYRYSKIILLCSGEDPVYSSSSTGSDVIMMSDYIYDIIMFSSARLKTQMTLSVKIINFRTFSSLFQGNNDLK